MEAGPSELTNCSSCYDKVAFRSPAVVEIVIVVEVPCRIEAMIGRLTAAHVASLTGEVALLGSAVVNDERFVVVVPCVSEMPVTVTAEAGVVVLAIVALTQSSA